MPPNDEGLQEAAQNDTLTQLDNFINNLVKLNENDTKSIKNFQTKFYESSAPVRLDPVPQKIKKRRLSGENNIDIGEYYECYGESKQLDKLKFMKQGVESTSYSNHEEMEQDKSGQIEFKEKEYHQNVSSQINQPHYNKGNIAAVTNDVDEIIDISSDEDEIEVTYHSNEDVIDLSSITNTIEDLDNFTPIPNNMEDFIDLTTNDDDINSKPEDLNDSPPFSPDINLTSIEDDNNTVNDPSDSNVEEIDVVIKPAAITCLCDKFTTYSELSVCVQSQCRSFMVTPITMSPGILVAQLDDDDDLKDFKHVKFASNHEWCNFQISRLVHFESKKYILLSVDPSISFDEVQKHYNAKGLGLVQKWLGDPIDEERSLQVVETFIEDDGSFRIECAVDKPLETKNPIHFLDNIFSDLSVSFGNNIVSLHSGKCTVRCRKAEGSLEFTLVPTLVIGYLSSIDETRNQNLAIKILKGQYRSAPVPPSPLISLPIVNKQLPSTRTSEPQREKTKTVSFAVKSNVAKRKVDDVFNNEESSDEDEETNLCANQKNTPPRKYNKTMQSPGLKWSLTLM